MEKTKIIYVTNISGYDDYFMLDIRDKLRKLGFNDFKINYNYPISLETKKHKILALSFLHSIFNSDYSDVKYFVKDIRYRPPIEITYLDMCRLEQLKSKFSPKAKEISDEELIDILTED